MSVMRVVTASLESYIHVSPCPRRRLSRHDPPQLSQSRLPESSQHEALPIQRCLLILACDDQVSWGFGLPWSQALRVFQSGLATNSGLRKLLNSRMRVGSHVFGPTLRGQTCIQTPPSLVTAMNSLLQGHLILLELFTGRSVLQIDMLPVCLGPPPARGQPRTVTPPPGLRYSSTLA
jgi:hypothetical protein